MIEVVARFPPKLEFLRHPHRYKVAYGGRGGTKSWGYARQLLIDGYDRPLRILCAREVQKSIRDSVHQLLCDQIEELRLTGHYEILANEIRGANGSSFLFAGLSDLTVESIKSFEGVDRCWVEEARNVSKRSWNILIPTIRRDGSEIWVSFNPELDTDETYQRFVVDPPKDAVVVKLTYRDNPWFPPVLEAERLAMLERDPLEYDNVWEGNCRPAVAGAIYAPEMAKVESERRVSAVPYDPKFKVHVVCDLGFNDAMAIVLVQRHLSEVRVIDYIEDTHRTLDSYSAQLRNMNLNWGTLWLPHDAKHKTLAGHGLSVQDQMRRFGWTTGIVPEVGVEPGIKVARGVLGRCYFNATKTTRLRECLKRYRRNVPSTTGEPTGPVHDEFSHGADAFRYMAIVADKMLNDASAFGAPLKYDNRGVI